MKKLVLPVVVLISSCVASRKIYNPNFTRLITDRTIQLIDERVTTESNTLEITPECIFINDSVSVKILKVIHRNPNRYVYVLDRKEMVPDCLEINQIGDTIVYYYACREIKTVLTASAIN